MAEENIDLQKRERDSSRLKTRENVVVWDFLAVDNFDFTRKVDKKLFG